MERVMSDVKIEHKVAMNRAEAAQWLADVAKELSGSGTVSIRLAESTVELKVPDAIRFEVELEARHPSGPQERCSWCLMPGHRLIPDR